MDNSSTATNARAGGQHPLIDQDHGGPGSPGPAPDFPLIVHCHLRWDFVWQRPQQVFTRFAEKSPVLFVEDPILVDATDAGAATLPRLEVSSPWNNVVRVVPMLAADTGDVDAQCAQVLPLLQKALRTHPMMAGRFERAVQWFYSPMTAPALLGKFGERGIVYDCMDELANFRFAPGDIADRERFLLSRADVVFTGGYELYTSKSRFHDRVHFHGCGVDSAHFGKARLVDLPVQPSVAGLPGPVLGYFGVVDERLDYELIAALADRFPEASVVIAGPLAKVEAADLPQRANLHWIGRQDYADLPALVKGFDVCLMPFALNEATRYINPTKTLEYMAAGKPVVSTAVADVIRNFTPVVQVGYSQDEFLGAVARAVEQPDAALLAQGMARAQAASWPSIVTAMRAEIHAGLAARGAGAAAPVLSAVRG